MPERRGTNGGGAAAASAGRAIWSGTISFGLVSVPVEVHSAIRRTGVSLRMLGPDGTPLARQYVCPADGEALDGEQIERGFEIGEDEYVIVTDEELADVEPRRSRDIALERFVPRESIDPAFFVRPYFLVPGGEQTKAYRLLAETMEATGRAGIASFVMRGKSYAVAILADQGILRAETLRFGDEVRTAEDVPLPEPCPVDKGAVKAMAKRIEALAEPALDESELTDDRSARLLALAQRKREQGTDVVEAPEETGAEADGGDVIDLMALIKERMSGGAPGRRGPQRGRERARRGGRRDELADASKQELYERARALDIPGRSKMSRAELLASIRRAG